MRKLPLRKGQQIDKGYKSHKGELSFELKAVYLKACPFIHQDGLSPVWFQLLCPPCLPHDILLSYSLTLSFMFCPWLHCAKPLGRLSRLLSGPLQQRCVFSALRYTEGADHRAQRDGDLVGAGGGG